MISVVIQNNRERGARDGPKEEGKANYISVSLLYLTHE